MPLSVPITQGDVLAVAAELANPPLTLNQWTLVLQRANTEVNEDAFGNAYRAGMAARYFAAHLALKVRASAAPGFGASSPAGPLASVQVGQVSKSFDTSGASMSTWSQQAEELRSTAYGREYLRLVRLWCNAGFAV